MKKLALLQTNFAQGEVSDFIEARPDVAKRYNGGRTLENVWCLPEGGVTRRPGTMWLCEVEDSSKFHRLIPFKYSVDDAFVLVFGDETIRFIKNRAVIVVSGTTPYQITSPYVSADLRDIHFEQSADYMFLTSVRTDVDIQKLIRIADANWERSNFAANPPPSYDADIDYSGGTITLTPDGTTGDVEFVASAPLFLSGDVNRQIIFGASRATITAVTDSTHADATILDAFPDTNPIPAGSWFFRGSPDGEFDPDRKEPARTLTTCDASLNAFRNADVGRFIKVHGGVLKIATVNAANQLICEIMSVLSDSDDANPAAATAGSWRMQDAAWSTSIGFPRTLRIHGGRLAMAGWPVNPTGIAGSTIDDLFSFAVGALADDAWEYTIQGGQKNVIQWLASHVALYVGDAEQEYSAKGRGVDAPISGDETPHVVPINFAGSRHVQPLLVDNALVFVQRFGQDVVILSYNLEQSSDATSLVGNEPTLFSRHIGEMIFANHALAYAAKPFSIVFMPLENGQLANFTFKPRQEVAAFTRTKTRAGDEIESVCVVPHETGLRLTVFQIVKRTINGQTKRYVEYYEDGAQALAARASDGVAWPGLVTDCAKVGALSAGATSITGLSHLALCTVDVIIGDSFIGQKTVNSAGVVSLEVGEVPPADTIYEVGLHFDSTATLLRPTIPGEVTELLKRHWPIVGVRVKNTIGGKVNGKPLRQQEGGSRMFSGLCKVDNVETEEDPYDGALSVVQDQPYPMTILNVAGKCAFADDQT